MSAVRGLSLAPASLARRRGRDIFCSRGGPRTSYSWPGTRLRAHLEEDTTVRSFKRSEEYLARAERTIPLGSQTFSKSRTQFPFGVSPYFVTRASGSRIWD